MKECPYCDKPFELAAQQPKDERLVALVCPECSWRVTVLKDPPGEPQGLPFDPPAVRDIVWLLDRMPADGSAERSAVLAVLVYAVNAIECIATERTRERMRISLECLRSGLTAKLRLLIDAPGKDGAK